MSKTAAERVREYRARNNMKGIDVTGHALNELRAYQSRWELPNLSVAIIHATTFSKPQ